MAICKWREMSRENDGGRKITNENIADIIAYNTRDNKTNNGKYIYCHRCNYEFLGSDFIGVTEEREHYNNRANIKHPYDEFYVSWGNEISPDQAFELSKKIAAEYLGDDYQYLITTHVDKNHIHSHFLFNCSNLRTHQMFDHTRSHRIRFLREINDRIARENDLSVVPENHKKTSVSRGEYFSRKYQRSFKFKAQVLIDRIVLEATDYQDFLNRLSNECEVDTSGKYTKIKLEGMKKYIRLKTLGADYYERSIMYRIEQKDLSFTRHPRFKYYDLNEEKFQTQQGLRNWAIRQNISMSFEQAKALEEIKAITVEQSLEEQLNDLYVQSDNLQKELLYWDEQIGHLQNDVLPALKEYPEFRKLLIEPYKELTNSKDRQAFKKAHYQQFKRYDQNIFAIKQYRDSSSRMPLSHEQINDMILTFSNIRNDIYKDYITSNKRIIHLQYLKSIKNDILNNKDIQSHDYCNDTICIKEISH